MNPPAETVIARAVRRSAPTAPAWDEVSLDYDGRFLRRRALRTERGRLVHVDLPETISLDDGDALVTETGALVVVRAAAEPLLEVAAPPEALVRLAWHVGNRHAPAQIEPGRLLIRADPVLADMLARLGAEIRAVEEPFRPEGGAYGRGRTHGHHHGGAGDDPHGHGGAGDAPHHHGGDGPLPHGHHHAPGRAHD